MAAGSSCFLVLSKIKKIKRKLFIESNAILREIENTLYRRLVGRMSRFYELKAEPSAATRSSVKRKKGI